MRRATVTCMMDWFGLGADFAERQEVEGYACEILGIAMVVHRAPQYEGGQSRNVWTVTEPITGLQITSHTTRGKALLAARNVILDKGGPDAVRREIERHGPATPTQGDDG